MEVACRDLLEGRYFRWVAFDVTEIFDRRTIQEEDVFGKVIIMVITIILEQKTLTETKANGFR